MLTSRSKSGFVTTQKLAQGSLILAISILPCITYLTAWSSKNIGCFCAHVKATERVRESDREWERGKKKSYRVGERTRKGDRERLGVREGGGAEKTLTQKLLLLFFAFCKKGANIWYQQVTLATFSGGKKPWKFEVVLPASAPISR